MAISDDIRYCVVCGAGSHRADWKELGSEEVHCDGCVLPQKAPLVPTIPLKPVVRPTKPVVRPTKPTTQSIEDDNCNQRS